MIWSEMSYIVICLCNNDPDFIFFLNRLVYSMPTVMSSVTGNHTMDFFHLLKENLLLKISYLTYWSWQGASRICFIFQVVHCLKGDSAEYARTYYEALNQTLLAQKYPGVVSQYILRFGSLWHPLSSSMLKNKQIFSLIISKLISAFSLWLYNLV